jgi:hypothetical protein
MLRCGYQRVREYPMARSEMYRRFARACLELARSTAEPQTRALMLQMAQAWQQLAERAES